MIKQNNGNQSPTMKYQTLSGRSMRLATDGVSTRIVNTYTWTLTATGMQGHHENRTLQ
jgi:hypothetical protein